MSLFHCCSFSVFFLTLLSLFSVVLHFFLSSYSSNLNLSIHLLPHYISFPLPFSSHFFSLLPSLSSLFFIRLFSSSSLFLSFPFLFYFPLDLHFRSALCVPSVFLFVFSSHAFPFLVSVAPLVRLSILYFLFSPFHLFFFSPVFLLCKFRRF